MEQVKLLTAEQSKKVSHITLLVNNFLSKKAMYEQKRQDKNNRTSLGGVSFFYQFDEENGIVRNVTLCWDTSPEEWDEAAMINEITEQEQYIDKRWELGQANSSNPFRMWS